MLQLSKDIGYVLYSAMGSFFIPSCIMVFVYIRIYYAAKARARRNIRKQPRPKPSQDNQKCTSFSTPVPSIQSPVDRNSNNSPTAVTLEAKQVAIPIVTCDFASDISTSDNAEGLQDPGGGEPAKDTLKVGGGSIKLQTTQFKGSSLSVNGDLAAVGRCRALSVGIDTDMVSEFDPSSSDSGVVQRCAVVKPLKLRFCKPIFGRIKTSSKTKRDVLDIGKVTSQQDLSAQEVPRIQKPRDPEREKRRIARKKEKRATLILGLIMGSFIACWLPFFFLYILVPICGVYCDIPGQAFSIAFWLGYMNSALNPVIYTIFNKDFRRAFRRILFK